MQQSGGNAASLKIAKTHSKYIPVYPKITAATLKDQAARPESRGLFVRVYPT